MTGSSTAHRIVHDSRVHAAVLLVLCFAAFSNNFDHPYHLDSGYTLLDNPAVRSLKNVPSYFVDPSTYTSLREQVDYRPVLQVTYAINYWLGGYNTWWWHFTQIVLHFAVTLGLYFLCLRILSFVGEECPEPLAFLAAIAFAVHPTASGVVNYLNARSSLLTAAFILPALMTYMRRIEEPRYARPAWGTAALYTAALFTKVEAVGALGALFAYEIWQRAREGERRRGFFGDLKRALDGRTLRRMAPALVVTAVYAVIRHILMAPYPFAEARHAADVTGWIYLLTQLTAWWYYVLHWVAPVGLVADHAAYPVYRSLFEPPVLLALGGWLLVGITIVAAWRRAPHLGFLLISALALLSPTSSISPLAEMVNEHRPYLPMGLLWLAAFVPLGRFALPRLRSRGALRLAYATGFVLVFASLFLLTRDRNQVFASARSYWEDVVAKAPSARAWLNLGLTYLSENDVQTALDHFERSLDLAPYWYIAHINAAIAYQRLGQTARASEHYDEAVRYDRFSGMARLYRGEFRLAQDDYEGALGDFQAALEHSLDRYRVHRGLATAYAGQGNAPQAWEHTDRLFDLDSGSANGSVVSISRPFFENPSRHEAGIRYFELARQRLPNAWWIYENIARLEMRLGHEDRAAEARAEADRLKILDSS